MEDIACAPGVRPLEETNNDQLQPTNAVESERRNCRRIRDRISGDQLGQTEKIRIGHLTPLTGFLGAARAYATLGMRMAEEESTRLAA